jgi:hypothetical protein
MPRPCRGHLPHGMLVSWACWADASLPAGGPRWQELNKPDVAEEYAGCPVVAFVPRGTGYRNGAIISAMGPGIDRNSAVLASLGIPAVADVPALLEVQGPGAPMYIAPPTSRVLSECVSGG